MMNNTKKIGNICFQIGLVIELIIIIIDKSAYTNPLEGQLFRLTFLLFCVKIATTKYSWREWLTIFLCGIVAMISYLVNDKDEVVRLIAFIAACKDIPLKKCLKTIWYITMAGCLALILLSITGIYGNTAMIADFGRCVVEKRYTLGMGHPNALFCMIWVLIVLGIYIYHDKMKLYHYAICLAILLGTYYITDSNTGLIIGTGTIFLATLLQYVNKLQTAKIIYIIGALILVSCIVFSLFGAKFGDGTPILWKIDDMINGRYKTAFTFENARLDNWTLFANPDNTEFFDAGFIRLFYWYGIIPAIGYFIMNFYLIYQSYKFKDYMMLIMIVVFSIYSLMEAHFISVYLLRNYLFVLMGYYWYQPFAIRGDDEAYFWQIYKLFKRSTQH
jgi:hypothetical protein